MKRSTAVSIMLFSIAVIAYAGQPKIKKTILEPEEAAAGDSIRLTIQFTGKHEDLKEVYLTVREYPYEYSKILLQPVEGKKNTWVVEETIPYEAPTGTYHLDVNAIDKDGNEIIEKGFENNSTGKAGTVILKITW